MIVEVGVQAPFYVWTCVRFRSYGRVCLSIRFYCELINICVLSNRELLAKNGFTVLAKSWNFIQRLGHVDLCSALVPLQQVSMVDFRSY